MKPTIVLGILLIISLANAQTQCNNETVSVCVQNMKQFQLDENTAVVPNYTAGQMTLMCSEYKKTDACLEKLIDDCSPFDRFYYRSVEASWIYICEDKRKEYLEIQECLAKPDLHEDADTHCTDTWKNRVEELDRDRFRHSSGILNKEGLSSLCNTATAYLNCIYTEVEIKCSKKAADWQRGFDDILIQPILQVAGCQARTDEAGKKVYVFPEEEHSRLSKPVIVIVAVSIALGVLVMVIIAILLLRHNKKDPRIRERPPAEQGHYAVYSPDSGAMARQFVEPPPYKEKSNLGSQYGPQYGIPMPPTLGYGPPPSYHPEASVYNDGRSVVSGRTARSHHSSKNSHGHVM